MVFSADAKGTYSDSELVEMILGLLESYFEDLCSGRCTITFELDSARRELHSILDAHHGSNVNASWRRQLASAVSGVVSVSGFNPANQEAFVSSVDDIADDPDLGSLVEAVSVIAVGVTFISPSPPPSPPPSLPPSPPPSAPPPLLPFFETQLGTLTLGSSSTLFLLILLLMCWVIYRHRKALIKARRNLDKQQQLEKEATASLAAVETKILPTFEREPELEPPKVVEPSLLAWSQVTLENLISSGSMGRIFRARVEDSAGRYDPARRYALRRLNLPIVNLHSLTEWKKQVKILHELDHPHLLRVLGLATDEVRNYGLLMPYMPLSLHDLLERSVASYDLASKLKSVWIRMMRDAASALAYLHSQHVTHRGLHPRNVLLDHAMNVQLADYGRSWHTVAHLLESKADDEFLEGIEDDIEEDGRFYMAPELLRFDAFGNPCDVWSLGCLIIRVASLRPLYDSSAETSSSHILLLRVAVGELGPLEDSRASLSVPSDLLVLLDECTKPEADDRPKCWSVADRLSQMVFKKRAPVPTGAASGDGDDSIEHDSEGLSEDKIYLSLIPSPSNINTNSVNMQALPLTAIAMPDSEEEDSDEDLASDHDAKSSAGALVSFEAGRREALLEERLQALAMVVQNAYVADGLEFEAPVEPTRAAALQTKGKKGQEPKGKKAQSGPPKSKSGVVAQKASPPRASAPRQSSLQPSSPQRGSEPPVSTPTPVDGTLATPGGNHRAHSQRRARPEHRPKRPNALDPRAQSRALFAVDKASAASSSSGQTQHAMPQQTELPQLSLAAVNTTDGTKTRSPSSSERTASEAPARTAADEQLADRGAGTILTETTSAAQIRGCRVSI